MGLVRVKIFLDEGAYMPTRGYETDAGLDLRCMEHEYLEAHESAEVNTGVHLVIPEGYAGVLVSKSGLNVKKGITTTGLIDANYTDSIRVRVYNHSEEYVHFEPGDKITQIVFVKIPKVELVMQEVLNLGSLRLDNGYGSTGR